MKFYDTQRGEGNPTHSRKLVNISRILLHDRSLSQDLRKVIAVKDQGALVSATLDLGFSTSNTGKLFEQHSGKVNSVKSILQKKY
ncbi:hypothetical protein [Stenotrophomonas hibiscicola]|uniref:hypothetical protein n=1 Tax=Stenotrophomonas hibiscicola TaxID=86189 RepID=UPI003D13645F